MKICSICGDEKALKQFPSKGLVCTYCINKKQKENYHNRKEVPRFELIELIHAVDVAMRSRSKAALECACKDCVKFCDKYKLYRRDDFEGKINSDTKARGI